MKYFLIVILFLTIFVGSCNHSITDVERKIDTSIKKQIKDGIVELPQLMFQQRMNWLISPLVLGVGAGVVLIFSGVRVIGIGVLVGSITSLLLLITLTMYMKYIAIIGIVILLVGLFYVGKMLYYRAIVNRELVASVEVAKILLPRNNKDILKKSLLNTQTKATKKVVSKIKRE